MSISAHQQFLNAEAEIKSLLTRERYYRDTAQWKKLRNSYHPDGSKTHIRISWFNGTADEFVSGSMKMASSGTVASHTFIPIEIHFSEDGLRAVSEGTGSITVRFSQSGGQYDCVSWTRFISRLQNVEGHGWRLCSMEVIYIRDSITTVVPGETRGEQEIRDGVAGGVPRESYKCLGFALEKGGFKVKSDMPGVDDPESVEKCMSTVMEWIQ